MLDDGRFSSRFLYQLVISQLQNDGFPGAAAAVADATSTPGRSDLPTSRLATLISNALTVERDRGVDPATGEPAKGYDSDDDSGPGGILGVYSGGTAGAPGAGEDSYGASGRESSCIENFDSESAAASTAPPKQFPLVTTRFIASHKNCCRVAKFSPDGRLLATGSADTSIKLLEVAKMLVRKEDAAAAGESNIGNRPVTRNFYDHVQPINDLDFHPRSPILTSAAKDCTIKFFDFGKPNVKKAFRYLQDTHNVRSINFHPTGDFLLAGTDHHMIRLYDVNTFGCYTARNDTDLHRGAVNQVRYAPEANMYVSCSKDGSIKVWDGVTNRCVTTMPNAHSGCEVSSVQFSRNGKYILSCGKDSTTRLWETSTGRSLCVYTGCTQRKFRAQAAFGFNEDFVMSSDERSADRGNDVVVWDSRKGELVQRVPGHTNIIRYIAVSPVDPFFVTCSDDWRARFWTVERGQPQPAA